MNKSNKIVSLQNYKKEFSETMNTSDRRNFSSSVPGNSYNIENDNSITDYSLQSYNDKKEENMKETFISEKTINMFLGTIAVTIAVLAVIISIAAWTIDKSIDSVNSNVNSKFDSISTEIKAINQRLDYQEKMNTIMIENEVNKKVNVLHKN